MNHTNINATGQRKARGTVTLLAALVMLGASARAEDMYQPSGITAGGVPAQAIQNAPVLTPTNCTFSWYGMRGWSTVFGSTNASGPYTNAIASTEAAEYAWSVTAAYPDSNNWFFILGQTNYYAGSGACGGCHGDKYGPWTSTLHASAFSALGNNGTNTGCIACHTVGYGQPTGFTNAALTPYLENVGCEDCHGPAGWHKNSDHEVIRPAITVAAEVCGGCHNGHNPQYNEWTNSPHAVVVSDFASGISDSLSGEKNLMNCGPCHSGATRIAMLEDYQNRLTGITNQLVLPSAHDGTNYAQTCAVCHDPHTPTYLSTNYVYTTNITYVTNISGNWGNYQTNIYANATNITSTSSVVKVQFQLRNPMNSTNYFTFFTAAPTVVSVYTNYAGVVTYTTNYVNDTFLDQYDPSIQICAQCHNSRGARWDGLGYTWTGSNFVWSTPSWSRPPHNSPQYNILIGIIQPDYLNTNGLGVATNMAATHSGFPTGVLGSRDFNTNQCATCHVPIYSSGGVNITGHTFALDTTGCAACHSSGTPDFGAFQFNTTNRVNNIVALLNLWATNYAPAILQTNYGVLAWEYTTAGVLGNPTGNTNLVGPPTAYSSKLPASITNANLQILIPVPIMQARFDLYMVNNDGSMGVHNPTYVPFLLNDAESKVMSQLTTNNGTVNGTAFSARSILAYTNTAVVFTNLTAGVASCSWTFGDANISASTNLLVTNYYATSGFFTVSLTTINTNGIGGAMTRPNYISVFNKMVPSFTYTPGPYIAPATVNFTNTSVNADYFAWVFENGVAGSPFSDSVNPSFTFTNAGVYQVKLTAYNEEGAAGYTSGIAVTNTITVTTQ